MLQPLRIQLPPQSPAPRASAPRWPASGQGPGHRRQRGDKEGFQGREPFPHPRPSVPSSTQLGPGDASSAPTASPGVAEPPGHLGTGHYLFLELCSQHLPCPLTSYGTGTAPLLPNGIGWASVHLPADSRLLQRRTRLLPSEAEPSPAARSSEPEAEGAGVLHSRVRVDDAGAPHLPAAPTFSSLLPGLGSVPHGPGQLSYRAGPRSALYVPTRCWHSGRRPEPSPALPGVPACSRRREPAARPDLSDPPALPGPEPPPGPGAGPGLS